MTRIWLLILVLCVGLVNASILTKPWNETQTKQLREKFKKVAQKLWPPSKWQATKLNFPKKERLVISDLDLAMQRLPRVVEVQTYRLQIWPHFPFDGLDPTDKQDLTFDGTVTISFTIIQDTQSIWLFAKNMISFDSLDLRMGDDSIPIDFIGTNSTTSRLEIKTVDFFMTGEKYSLTITYKGHINEWGDGGLYYTNYLDSNGKEQYLVGTFFEPMKARTMFPSFDDPWFKATFKLTVIYPKQANIYANTLIKNSRPYNSKYQIADFVETGKMSNYLLAFTIGHFKVVSAKTSRGINVQTIAEPYLEKYLAESAKISANCIDAMEGLVKVNFPWGKLDNVEMIHMGQSGAMENIGLIIYKKSLSLLPIATPAHDRLNQMAIMCHETAHQWFGDLVTADHWGLEFLHESFASFFQARTVQEFKKEKAEHELLETDIVLAREMGLYAAQASNHGVVSDQSYFDGVTYLAGGAILRMIERMLGTADFFSALTNYLKNNQFGNADDNALITEFENVKNNQNLCGNLEMRTVMADFLKNPHHPIVFVFIEDGYYKFYQDSDPISVWTVPIFAYNLRTGEESIGYSLVNQSTCPEKWLKADDPYIFNYKSTSFARFRYNINVLNSIISSNLSNLDDSTLLGLIFDQMEYENIKGYPIYLWQSIKIFQKTIQDKKGNVSPIMVDAVLSKILAIRKFYSNGDAGNLYRHTLNNLFGPIYKLLNWDASDLKQGLLNTQFLPIAVRYDIGDAQKKAKTLFDQFKKNCSDIKTANIETCNTIQADAREAVYCQAAQIGDDADVAFLQSYWERLLKDAQTYFYLEFEIDAVVKGLGCIKTYSHLESLMNFAFAHNQPGFINSLAYNYEIGQQLYNFILKNVDLFYTQLSFLENALQAMISTWYTQQDLINILKMTQIISKLLPLEGRRYLSDAAYDVEDNMEDASVIMPQFTRWMWDTQVIIGRDVWTKPLTDVNPENINYKLRFVPNYPMVGYPLREADAAFSFDGIATITFTNTYSDKRKISINSHRQLIYSIEITSEQTKIGIATMSRDYDNGILTIYLNSAIKKDKVVTIKIVYMGLMISKDETSHEGIGISQYFNPKSQEAQYILVTEMAGGTNPRSLIPCFDEPKYKATWDISIEHASVVSALSNGRVLKEELSDRPGYTITTFETTKPMSSYLLAIAVGKFGYVSGVTNSGVSIKVWAPSGYEIYGEVAVTAAQDAINYLDKLTQNGYSSSINNKLDIIAAPEYAGAMENWGIIVGKFDYVLFDPDVQTYEDKQKVFTVVAHEVIHQWWGDLVTTKDWKNTFLSEGFATFFESVVYDFSLSRGEKLRFIATEDALRFDETSKSTIIPSSIDVPGFAPFTLIVYNKPASVFHSLYDVIGQEGFEESLRSYINQFKYKNAIDTDLWNCFNEAANKYKITGWDGNALDVKKFMDPYFRQASYPILFVDYSPSDGLIHIRESSFYDPSKSPKSDYNYTWPVPVTWNDNGFEITQWAVGDGELTSPMKVPVSAAAYLNHKRKNYARVQYSDTVWSEIVKNFNNPKYYNASFRAAAISDTYSFVKSGKLEWGRLLSLLQYLKYEYAELPWMYGYEVLEELFGRLKFNPGVFEKFKNFLTDIIADRGGYIPADGWSYTNSYKYINKVASRFQIGKFVGLAKDFMDNSGKTCLSSTFGVEACLSVELPPDDRPSMLCSGLQTYPEYASNLEGTINLFVSSGSSDPFLYSRVDPYIEAIACIQNETLTTAFLMTIYGGFYEPFARELLRRISLLDLSGKFIYDWLTNNKIVLERIEIVPTFEAVLQAMVMNWSSKEHLDLFNSIEWEDLSIQQMEVVWRAQAKIKENIDWQNKHFDSIAKWLNANY